MSAPPVFYICIAGYSARNELRVNTGICQCGPIEDGVAFELDNEGGWVVPFADLERVYLAACAARAKAEGRL